MASAEASKSVQLRPALASTIAAFALLGATGASAAQDPVVPVAYPPRAEAHQVKEASVHAFRRHRLRPNGRGVEVVH